jgi:hypothetical protein
MCFFTRVVKNLHSKQVTKHTIFFNRVRLNGQALEVVNTHKILRLTLDIQLTWRPHIENVKTNAVKDLTS